MKYIVLFVALITGSLVWGADLKLQDGRILIDYRIVSQTPMTVLVRHSKGAAKIEKKLLPADVLATFPIDQAGAKIEADEIARGRAVYEARAKAIAEKETIALKERKVDAEKKQAAQKALEEKVKAAEAKAREDLAIETAVNEVNRSRTAAQAIAELPKQIKDAVRRRAERELKTAHQSGSNATLKFDLEIDVEEPRPVVGWTDRWEVIGVGWFQFFDAKGGGSFASDKSWFRADVRRNHKKGDLEITQLELLRSEPNRPPE